MRNAIVIASLLLLTFGAAHATKIDPGPRDTQTDGLLDCNGASAITCGEIQTNIVPDGPGNVDLYGCTGLSYDGSAEFVYELCVGGNGGNVSLVMTYDHNTNNDLDLFLLGSCEEADCIDSSLATSGIEEIAANVPAGTYYVVVDGWGGRSDNSPHVLSVECDEPCGATPVDASTWGQIKSLHQ